MYIGLLHVHTELDKTPGFAVVSSNNSASVRTVSRHLVPFRSCAIDYTSDALHFNSVPLSNRIGLVRFLATFLHYVYIWFSVNVARSCKTAIANKFYLI